MPRGVAVLVWRDGALLLGLRQGSHGAGTWAAPGGRPHEGEDVHACAARELREETGLVATALHDGPPPVAWTAETGETWDTQFVVATVPHGDPERREPDKCAGWGWYAPEALPAPLFGPLALLRARGELGAPPHATRHAPPLGTTAAAPRLRRHP